MPDFQNMYTSVTFVYIGKRLPSSTQKHYDVLAAEEVYVNNNPTQGQPEELLNWLIVLQIEI